MANLWVRTGNNGTDPAFFVDDLGFEIPTGAGWTALTEGSQSDPFVDGYGQFTARELRDSDDLYEAITGGSLEFSVDGVNESTDTYIADLPITREFRDDDFDLRLGRLTVPNDINPPVNISDARPGDLFYDTDDGYLVFYSGVLSQFITITDSGSVISDHGALAGLLDDDHTQYALLSGNAARNPVTGKFDFGTDAGELGLPKSDDPTTNFPSAVAGDIAYDTDDGYLVFYNGTAWTQIAGSGGVTDHGALSGLLDDDHTQYGLLTGAAARNAITGEYDFTGGQLRVPTATDPTAAYPGAVTGNVAVDSNDGYMVFHDGANFVRLLDEGDLPFDHGGLGGLLDDDHTQYGLLAGNAARNAITGTYDFGDGYLIAPTYSVAPTENVVEGEVAVVGGLLYAYDSTRSKWLSVDRNLITAGRNQAGASNIYLRVEDRIPSNQSSYRALRDGTITALFGNTNATETWTVEIRLNGSTSPSASLVITAATGDQDITIDVDFSAGDTIEFFCNGTNINRPFAGAEIAWRI